jgi:hypothetical protein
MSAFVEFEFVPIVKDEFNWFFVVFCCIAKIVTCWSVLEEFVPLYFSFEIIWEVVFESSDYFD